MMSYIIPVSEGSAACLIVYAMMTAWGKW